MRALLCLLLIFSLSGLKAQQLSDQRKPGIFSHMFVGFEIGSNFLDIEQLNSEIASLELLTLDPYTNNYTFQVGAGLTYFEVYSSLSLVATGVFTNVVGPDRLFLSTTLNGTYVGIGLRRSIIRVLKERLSLVASVDLSSAYYSLDLSMASIPDRNVAPLLDSSQAIMAHADNRIVQPALELSYAVLKKKNRLDIGFRVGYIYHLEEREWANQHGVGIIGLSPIKNKESYNIALRFVYQFARSGYETRDP